MEPVKVIKSVVPYVVDALEDSDSWARGRAALALGEVSKQRKRFGHLHSQAHLLILFFAAELFKEIENVVPRIVELLKDTKQWVRFSANCALGEMSKQRK